MTEILIQNNNFEHLLQCFKLIFNSIVIEDTDEYTLEFDNDIGHGNISIIKLEDEAVNMYFNIYIKRGIHFKFYNFTQSILNSIYLKKGKIEIKNERSSFVLEEDHLQQAIYSKFTNADELLLISNGKTLEFNMIKVFDNNFLKRVKRSNLLSEVVNQLEYEKLSVCRISFFGARILEICRHKQIIDLSDNSSGRIRHLKEQITDIIALQLVYYLKFK